MPSPPCPRFFAHGRPSRRRLLLGTLVLIVLASIVSNVALAWKLHRARTVEKVRAWRSCHKLSMQHILYDRALALARADGRRLVVIGNPTGGYVNRHVQVYGCGDICIDIAGCRPCGHETRVLAADALEALRTLPDDSAVVFESEVLEYVVDLPAVIRELDRVTGGDHTRIFSVHTISIDSWRYHTLGLPAPPPDEKTVQHRRQERRRYARTGEGLARRIIYRFPPRNRYAWTDI